MPSDRSWASRTGSRGRALRVLLAALLLMTQALVAQAQQSAGIVAVDSIRFEGLSSWDPEQLKTRLSTKVGQPYNPLLVREDLTRLAGVMRRANVRTEANEDRTVDVIFKVEEFPRLRQVQILGNETVPTSRIESLIGVKPGDVLDDNVVGSLRRAVTDEHRQRGLAEAQVEVKIAWADPPADQHQAPGFGGTPGAREADLHVIVNEGSRIVVDDLVIEGNQAFSTPRLRFMVETSGSWLFFKNYYNDSIFEEDLVTLRRFYASQGYFDAIVERGEFRRRDRGDRQILTPVIRIQEGEKYRLGEVRVLGASLFSVPEVKAPFEDLQGRDFDGKKFGKALEQVEKLYMDAGLLSTRIEPAYENNAELHSVDVVLNIDEKQRIYVGDVKLKRPDYEVNESPGAVQRFYEKVAPPITDEAILREVLLQPGEVYDKSLEQRSQERLEALGVFSKVSIVNEPTADPNVQNVLVSVEESSTGNFYGGIGFGDASGAFVFATFNERNLFGDARDLRVQGQLGTRASNVFVSYRDRHFRDTDNILTASAFYNRYRRPGYIEQALGTRAELAGLPWGDWEGAVQGRLEYIRLNEADGYDPKEDLDVSYPVTTIGLSAVNDTSYPRANPSEGRRLSAGVEAGYADGPLLKFTGGAEYHVRLSKNFVYHFSPSGGLIPYDSDSVGITERFFLGGADDLRGFEFRGAGRRDEDDEDVGIGGAVKLLVRNELSFPIYDPVSGVVFMDVGTLGESPFDIETPRASAGVGARFAWGRTTVALDLAAPLLKEDDDQTQFLHFRFDSSF